MTSPCPPVDEDATFWTGRIEEGEPLLKTCGWLKDRSPKIIEYLCSLTDEFESELPARDVCTDICETCD